MEGVRDSIGAQAIASEEEPREALKRARRQSGGIVDSGLKCGEDPIPYADARSVSVLRSLFGYIAWTLLLRAGGRNGGGHLHSGVPFVCTDR